MSIEVRNTSISLAEQLDPRVTPEMALQTYELFAQTPDSPVSPEAFLRGEVLHFDANYVGFTADNITKLYAMEQNLLQIWEAAETSTDPAVIASRGSIAYRLAEVYFLQQAARLNSRVRYDTVEDRQLAAVRFKEMNEQLYGVPDQKDTEDILGHYKPVVEAALSEGSDEYYQGLARDIQNAHIFTAQNGESEIIPALEFPETFDPLPSPDPEVYAWLGKKMNQKYEPFRHIISEYWRDIAVPRAMAQGEQPAFYPLDIVAVFKFCSVYYEQTTGQSFSSWLEPGSGSVAWSSEKVGIPVGANRAPILSVDPLYGISVHEVGKHADCYINGRLSGIPAFATGMYSEADKGESVDYLSFEEGDARLRERASDATDFQWDFTVDHVMHLALAKAYEGWDDRQCYEQFWRLAVLSKSRDLSRPMPPDEVGVIQKEVRNRVWRVFRGTPVADLIRVDGATVTYNKDVGYYPGMKKAIEYYNRLTDMTEAQREHALALASVGKIDPTNRRQRELGEQVLAGTFGQ